MGKGLDKFLNMMRLNDDDYEDDEYAYDDDDASDTYDEPADDTDEESEHEERTSSRKKKSSFRSRFKGESEEEYEEEDEEDAAAGDSYASSRTTSSTSSARSSSSRSKIVPMKRPQSRAVNMEVSIQRPASFEDSCEICEVLLDGKAAIVNLEGIELETAQRIIDFVSGSCYAMAGNIQKVSGYIFIVTPAGIDISGDVESAISGGDSSKVDMSAFRLNV